MSQPIISGQQVWCPQCNNYAQFIKIAFATQLVGVNRRTIYRYIDEGQVYSFRVAGKTRRICSTYLVRHD